MRIISTLLALSGLGLSQGEFFLGGCYGLPFHGNFEYSDTIEEISGLQGDYLASFELGYRINYGATYSAFSLEYLHTGFESDLTPYNQVQEENGFSTRLTDEEFKTSGVMFNGRFGRNFNDSLSAYLGGGIGVMQVSNEYSGLDEIGTFSVDLSETLLTGQLIAGVELRPVPQFGLFAELRYVVTMEAEEIGRTLGAETYGINDGFFLMGGRFYF